MVKAFVPKGKKKGFHIGKLTTRSNSSCYGVGKVDGINAKHIVLLQKADGYTYIQKRGKGIIIDN